MKAKLGILLVTLIVAVSPVRSIVLAQDGGKGDSAYAATLRIVSYEKPTIDGYRIDICLTWGNDCGEVAAAEFCRRKNHVGLEAFGIEENIGLRSPTWLMNDAVVCNQDFCDGFVFIACRG